MTKYEWIQDFVDGLIEGGYSRTLDEAYSKAEDAWNELQR